VNCYLVVIFWIVALGFSVFYGWYAVTIHLDEKDKDDRKQYGKLNTWRSPQQSPSPHGSWWFHQMWLNFVGSFAGWAALFYLSFFRIPAFKNGKTEFGLADAFFVLLALLGVTGLLPWRLFNTSVR
jgi:hypothetical protein